MPLTEINTDQVLGPLHLLLKFNNLYAVTASDNYTA